MEPVKGSERCLANYEVLSLLQGVKNKVPKQQNVATVTYEAIKYLSNTPCALQNDEIVRNFIQDVAKFKLTTEEQIELLNHRPTKQEEIFILINKCDDRFSNEELAELLTIIQTRLPGQNDDGEAEGGN